MLAFFFTEKHLDENNFSKNIFRTVSDRIFTVIVLEDEHSATITCGFCYRANDFRNMSENQYLQLSFEQTTTKKSPQSYQRDT